MGRPILAGRPLGAASAGALPGPSCAVILARALSCGAGTHCPNHPATGHRDDVGQDSSCAPVLTGAILESAGKSPSHIVLSICVNRCSSAANRLPQLPACLKYQVHSDSATLPAILADLHFCVALDRPASYPSPCIRLLYPRQAVTRGQ